jgi:hypothetical protein
MNRDGTLPDSDFLSRLKWLIFSRILFSSILLGSTVILQLRQSVSFFDPPLLILYLLIFIIFFLSFCYVLILKSRIRPVSFAYGQIILDTLVVTLIIFVTGSYNSVFSFLYLVVIIYSSILLYSRGSMVIAALCSCQYALLIGCEYYGLINPYSLSGDQPIPQATTCGSPSTRCPYPRWPALPPLFSAVCWRSRPRRAGPSSRPWRSMCAGWRIWPLSVKWPPGWHTRSKIRWPAWPVPSSFCVRISASPPSMTN